VSQAAFDSNVKILSTLPGSHVTLRAVKILSAWATSENREGRLHELPTLEAVAECAKTNPTAPLPVLLDHFDISGPHGDHLALVTSAYSTSVNHFRLSTPSKPFALTSSKPSYPKY